MKGQTMILRIMIFIFKVKLAIVGFYLLGGVLVLLSGCTSSPDNVSPCLVACVTTINPAQGNALGRPQPVERIFK